MQNKKQYSTLHVSKICHQLHVVSSLKVFDPPEYLLSHHSKVATVDIETGSVIAAAQGKQDLMMDMLQGMMERLDRLEKQICPTRAFLQPLSLILEQQ